MSSEVKIQTIKIITWHGAIDGEAALNGRCWKPGRGGGGEWKVTLKYAKIDKMVVVSGTNDLDLDLSI